MKEILYMNDVVHEVELPEGWHDFTLRYYVDRFNSAFASWRGGDVKNCSVDGNKVHVLLHDHHLGIGELMCEKSIIMEYGGGTVKESTGIKLVGEFTKSTAIDEGDVIDLDNVDCDDDGEYITIK